MIRTTLLRALAALAAGTALVAASGMARLQPDPLAPPSNGPRKADPTWHALRNATVHVQPGQVLEHATVVVRDGRIVSVKGTPKAPEEPKKEAPAAAATATDKQPEPPKDDVSKAPAGPAGARTWDCTGLHIYPGFIDPYVEIDVPAPPADAPGLHWNARVTPQRSAADVRGVDASLAESLRKIGYTAAGVSPRGGIFRGSAAVVSLAAPEADRSLARPPVYAENVYQAVALETGGGRGGTVGTDTAPAAWSGYPNSQMGAIALVRQTFADADWQAAARASGAFTEQPNCLDSIAPAASAGDAAKGIRYVFNTDDEMEVFRVVKIANEFNRPAIVLGTGTEFRRLDGIVDACKDVPFIIPLNFPDAPRLTTMGQIENVDLRELMTWEQAPTNPRRLEKAGLEVSLTTSKIRDRSKFRENLRKAIAHGLTEDQALAMITTRPAELLGVAGTMGTVEQGKLANLVVTDGNIFGAKTQLRDVWVDGKRHELAAAPSNLKGEWEITMTPAPKASDGASVRITWSIDKDNVITVRKHVKEGDAEAKVTKASAKGVRVESAGYGAGTAPTKVAFSLDHEPLGSPGVFTIAGVVEGDTMMGDGLRADGTRFSWTAVRTADEPVKDPPAAEPGATPSFAGTWTMTEDDGDPVDAALVEQGVLPTVVIDRDNAVTVKIGGEEFKAESTKVEGKTITIRIDGEPFGWDGMITSSGEVEGDTMTGVATLADGTKRSWKFKRAETPGRPEGRRGGRGGGRPEVVEVVRPADAISGDWSGTSTSPQLPEPLPFTMSLKLTDSGAVTGTVSSRMGTHDLAEGTFTKSGDNAGAFAFKLLTPEGDPMTFKMDVTPNAMSGTGTGNQMTFSLTASRAAPTGSAAAATDGEEETPKDIPESYGYPFGPYAVDSLPAQDDVVFEHATIWTSGPQGVIADGSMRIKDGKILWIADNTKPGAYKVDPGTKVVDARGKHITPGLIDCHSHTGISRGVNESGQAVTAEVRIQDVTDPDAISWYYQLAGGITAVNNLHGSANPIGGQNAVNKNRWGSRKPDDLHFEGAIPGIKFALGENVKRSNGGQGNDRYPNTRMGVETLIRDRFTAAREYAKAMREGGDFLPSANEHSPAQRATPRRDLELECLAEILAGERLIHCHSYRQDEILMLCRVAKDFGFKLGTFQHILEGYKVADEVRDNAIGASAFSDWWAYKVEVQDAIPYGGAIMHDVGVTVSFNSDSDELARRMNVEAGKAVKYGGLDPAEALKFVTINPARQLKVDDRVGSLEPGKDADFAIWTVPPGSPALQAGSNIANVPEQTSGNGNRPLNAAPPPPSPSSGTDPARRAGAPSVEGTPLSTMARCEQTWVDGRCYFSTERDAEMRQKNATERARLVQKLLASGNKRPGAAGGAGAPGADGPPVGGPPRGRRGPRPTDDGLTSGAFDEPFEDEEAPRSLLGSMLKRAADQRREYHLQLWRRGVDPSFSRCGDCGESLGGAQ